MLFASFRSIFKIGIDIRGKPQQQQERGMQKKRKQTPTSKLTTTKMACKSELDWLGRTIEECRKQILEADLSVFIPLKAPPLNTLPPS